jgi:outer membrane protein OmpA-like peptidoglycan-associated protein
MKTNQTRVILLLCLIIGLSITAFSQGTTIEPRWWFGGALGVNMNIYGGDVRQLNASTLAAGTFSGGSGIGLFLSPLAEYHPNRMWGGMLALGFDGRSGSFSDLNGEQLSATVNYLTLEPSVRLTPFENNFYFFAGPRIGFAMAKSFSYKTSAGETTGDWGDSRGAVLGLQIGAGYDLPISATESDWQTRLSPFVALHIGQGPRSSETWSLTTLRLGLALKFGNTREVRTQTEQEVSFSVRAPRMIPNTRTVKETFPMRNYLFFDAGSAKIPYRYITLTAAQAGNFREDQLLQPQPNDLSGRSQRQMTVYHNVLNVLGDRLRRNPNAAIQLTGSSEQGADEGRQFADAVRQYLVDVFGIDGSRIRTEGRAKPANPSVLPGASRELELVRPEDRRVDIASSTPQILEPVQILSLQEEPLDSDVLFTVDHASDHFASWSVVVTDDAGQVKRYGPFTGDQERISGKQILGGRTKGTYTVALEGQTNDGQQIRKEESIHLLRSDEPEEAPGYRFSILFEFDQSKTVATYERFLTKTVAPLIASGSSVIIHGHTDIIGEEGHNLKLSQDRARETMNFLQSALNAAGVTRVKFDTYGFGEDPRRAPFDNQLPEERFYNRCVIIDIVPAQ